MPEGSLKTKSFCAKRSENRDLHYKVLGSPVAPILVLSFHWVTVNPDTKKQKASSVVQPLHMGTSLN